MRVLMLSWEYPPVVVGGLGRHVHAVATSLVDAGHEVAVVTRHVEGAAFDEVLDGVRVVRAGQDPPLVPFDELLAWTLALNHGMARCALRLVDDGFSPDVVHAHDWLVAHAAKTVKDAQLVPLVATVHATEAGRHQGWLPGPVNRAIHTVEWWLTYEARRVVTCSSHMRWEVTRLFDLPPEKVDIVPNGVVVPRASARPARHAAGPRLLFVGRLEYEKGVQTLLQALPRLRRAHPGLTLTVVGSGTHEPQLREQARRLRLGRAVTFTGRLDPDEVAVRCRAADVAVVPSLYEPFGLVALEAAAAGTPLVVARTGGLRELVVDGRTGRTFPPGDVAGLAAAVDALLSDQVLARRMARNARAAVARHYTWATTARRVAEVYERAVRQERALRAGLLARAEVPLRMVVRDGNLLTGEA